MDSSTPFRLPRKTPFGIGENVAEWATGLSQLDKFYAQRPVNADTKTFLRFTLDILGIDYRIAHGSLGSVPKQGATVISLLILAWLDYLMPAKSRRSSALSVASHGNSSRPK